MQRLLSRIRQRLRQRQTARQAERAQENALETAIEQVVDQVEPRIRAIAGYRKKLRPAVRRALEFADRIHAQIPGPVEISKATWSSDPLVRAIFASAGDIPRLLSESREVQAFSDGVPVTGQPKYYAILSMMYSERTVLGIEMAGDTLKRDVRQTAVNFTGHMLVRPRPSLDELRGELKKRAFEVLVAHAMERIAGLKISRTTLQEQKHLTEMQLRLAQAKNAGFASLIGDDHAEATDEAALRQQLQAIEQEFEQTHSRLEHLDDYISRITDVLGQPEKYLKARQFSIRITDMNIEVENPDRLSGHELNLTEVSLGEELKRIVMIAAFTLDEAA